MKYPGVYILTNKKNTTFYTGESSDLIGRVYQHKKKLIEGFTKKYNLTKLVYYEITENKYKAIEREKYIKGKKRSYKIKLIKKLNPEFRDLYKDLKDSV